MWLKNTDRILEMMNVENVENVEKKITIAELNRNKGNFDICINLIKSIAQPSLVKLQQDFLDECSKKNTKVFELYKK